MDQQKLIARLGASAGQVPSQADVIGLQQLSLDNMLGRTKRLLAQVGAAQQRSLDKGDWQPGDGHTAVRLPQGARALLYHASGGMQYRSGLAPFESLFGRMKDAASLTRIVEEAAKKCDIASWAGKQGTLVFERLWQMKAQGADKNAKLSDPVLCRAVGAYRHVIDGMPVLGPASVALRLAGDGTLDLLSVQVRDSAAEVIEKATILAPELAAKQIALQLTSLLGQAKESVPDDALEWQAMRFGYLNLGKRKAQRLLAPVFMAQVTLQHKLERQAYVFAVSATEKPYLPLCQCGDDGVATMRR